MCASSAAGAAKKGQPWARPQGVSENERFVGHTPPPPIAALPAAFAYYLLVS